MSDSKLFILGVYMLVLHIFAINGILAWSAHMGW